jgi:FkbH-like protein
LPWKKCYNIRCPLARVGEESLLTHPVSCPTDGGHFTPLVYTPRPQSMPETLLTNTVTSLVEQMFRFVRGHECSPHHVQELVAKFENDRTGTSLTNWLDDLMSSRQGREHLRARLSKSRERDPAESRVEPSHSGVFFSVPDTLSVTPTTIRRVLFMGPCLLERWDAIVGSNEGRPLADLMLVNHLSVLPPAPPHPISDYDFHFVYLPYRTVLPEQAYMRLSYTDTAGFEDLYRHAKDSVAVYLREMLRWNREHGTLTFLGGFLSPQQNAMGRLLPRHDIRNLVYLTEQLNIFIEDELKQYQNTHYIDLNQIASSLGKRYIQDDSVFVGSHGGTLNNFDAAADRSRIAPVPVLTQLHDVRVEDFVLSVWAELKAMFRTIKQIDQVKLVICDLDDTLWKGVLAEADHVDGSATSGWPQGVLEALSYLKKRGVLLSVVSRNEESRVREIWPIATGNRLSLDDFAFIRINWGTKADSIGEIISLANVLPSSVVFVDDNPAERAAAETAFPGIRTIGANQYYIRRILLWSSETQVPFITDESSRRTEMMQAQAKREAARKVMSREELLQSLAVRITLAEISSVGDPKFKRCFELINKTNQFNTTGKRWAFDEFVQLFASDGSLVSFTVADKYTDYGLVGVLVIRGNSIDQVVMSCRVLGLDVEQSVIRAICMRLADQGHDTVVGTLMETPANFPCRDLYSKCGFAGVDGRWSRTTTGEL